MFQEDMQSTKKAIRGAVFIECLPRNGVEEVAWVRKNGAGDLPHAIVARADLAAPEIEETLIQLTQPSSGTPVCGIRHILNWEPTWPFVQSGEIVSSSQFQHGCVISV
jgi:hypothetical protein